MYFWSLLLSIVALHLSVSCANASTRVALLIGNAAYEKGRLSNPEHDVERLAAAFRAARFDVVRVHTNLGRAALSRVLDDFETVARDSDVAVIFYSGHGIEFGGTNYLVPVDATLASDRDVKYESIALDDILFAVDGARRLKLVILDACRDNPFVGAMRRVTTRGSVGKGLARTEASTQNMLIAYATAPGEVAADGERENSPFTRALLGHLFAPGLDIRIALGRVRDDVIEATRSSGRPQVPFQTGSVGGEIVTLSSVPKPGEAVTQAPPNRPLLDLEQAMRQDFDRARLVGTRAGWDAFLKRVPTGLYADLARAERAKLSSIAPAQKPAVTIPAPSKSVVPQRPNQPPETRKFQSGRPDPLFYSFSLWERRSLRGQSVSARTPYGTLNCISAPPRRRSCSWGN